jgi:PAS domain S-box-containing protein
MPRKSTGRTQKQLLAENEDLRRRLDEAEEILRAIRSGEVDALVIMGVGGEQIMTLKQVEEALQDEKVREQQYLDIAGVMFLVLAVDRKVILINKKGCEILGYVEQEIVGRNWCDHFLPQDQKDRVGAIFDQLMTGKSERGEYFENPVLTKSGQQRLVAWHNSLLTDKTGRIIGVVSSGEDVTERRRAEELLAQRTVDLGERVKELRCIYGISRLIAEPDKSVEVLFAKAVRLIPAGWNHPEITCARIAFREQEFVTDNFKETHWKLSADIHVSGKKQGSIDVYYLEKRPVLAEGPFLKEERDLINALARNLGDMVERKRAEEEIMNLALFPEENPNPILRVQKDGMLL